MGIFIPMDSQQLKEFLRSTVRNTLKEIRLHEEAEAGLIPLYHYSTSTSENLVLKPEKFGSNPHSRREMNTSDVPRVFFYTDPREREQELFGGTYNLFTTSVPTNQIYDLKKDPLKLYQEYGRYGIHEILTLLSGWKRDSSGWTKLPPEKRPEQVQNIKGALYDLGRFKVVVWFDSITVTKVDPEQKAALEKK
jgi:hypothetical protein